MGYEQIDGNKNILVNERGQVREDLSNIKPHYEYDEEGNIDTDRWPTVVVQSSTEGQDRRLLPAEVLKLHGDLPKNGNYTRDMFDAKDGDKTNCAKENIIYNESAPSQPYKSKPGEEEPKGSEEPKNQPTGTVVEDPTKTAGSKSSQGSTEDDQEPEENSSGNKITGQSQDYNATEAQEIIKNNSFEDLQAAGFYNELDGPKDERVTVTEQWEKKKNQAESG